MGRKHYRARRSVRRETCKEIDLEGRMKVEFRFIEEQKRGTPDCNVCEQNDKLADPRAQIIESIGATVCYNF